MSKHHPRAAVHWTAAIFRAADHGWLRGTVPVVERRSLTGEPSLSCARPTADG